MPTFCEIYCQKHHCTREQFARQVFWKSLYPHARVFVPLLLVLNRDYFVADRSLINAAADAVTMRAIRDEVRDYFWDSNNSGWLRRVANVRVSGQRLKYLARRYVPESDAGIRGNAAALPAEDSGAPFQAPGSSATNPDISRS